MLCSLFDHLKMQFHHHHATLTAEEGGHPFCCWARAIVSGLDGITSSEGRMKGIMTDAGLGDSFNVPRGNDEIISSLMALFYGIRDAAKTEYEGVVRLAKKMTKQEQSSSSSSSSGQPPRLSLVWQRWFHRSLVQPLERLGR